MNCYLLTFMNGKKVVFVSNKDLFSLDVYQYNLPDSSIVSVQMLNCDDVIVVSE